MSCADCQLIGLSWFSRYPPLLCLTSLYQLLRAHYSSLIKKHNLHRSNHKDKLNLKQYIATSLHDPYLLMVFSYVGKLTTASISSSKSSRASFRTSTAVLAGGCSVFT